MEITLVHPNNKEQKVVANHPQQVTAFKGRGFVEVGSPEEPTARKEAVQPAQPEEEQAQVAKTEQQSNEKGSK